jgi:hypothetical protein
MAFSSTAGTSSMVIMMRTGWKILPVEIQRMWTSFMVRYGPMSRGLLAKGTSPSFGIGFRLKGPRPSRKGS